MGLLLEAGLGAGAWADGPLEGPIGPMAGPCGFARAAVSRRSSGNCRTRYGARRGENKKAEGMRSAPRRRSAHGYTNLSNRLNFVFWIAATLCRRLWLIHLRGTEKGGGHRTSEARGRQPSSCSTHALAPIVPAARN